MAGIGPVLPPGFKPSSQSHSDSDDDNPEDKSASTAEEKQYIGPVLPPGMQKAKASDSEDSSSDSEESSGDEEARPVRTSIGPSLPPGFKGPSASGSGLASNALGPALPPGFVIERDSDSDDDVIGPTPHDGPIDDGSVAEEFEKRAQKMRDHLRDKDKEVPQERESWMMELPPEMGANIGLTARKFRSGAGGSSCGDRSVWTDTPADKEKRAKDAAEGKPKKRKKEDLSHILSARDKYLSDQVDEYNKTKRAKSLLELHESKMKKKKKKEKKKAAKKAAKDKDKGKSDKPSRREFDRDTDMQANRFDDAMRKSVIKRSQQLGGRFAHGEQRFV